MKYEMKNDRYQKLEFRRLKKTTCTCPRHPNRYSSRLKQQVLKRTRLSGMSGIPQTECFHLWSKTTVRARLLMAFFKWHVETSQLTDHHYLWCSSSRLGLMLSQPTRRYSRS